MQQFKQVWVFTMIIGSFLLSSCNTNYKVVKSNRIEYGIAQDMTVDSTVIQTYLPYKANLDSEFNKVIGHSALMLSKTGTEAESLLGNFFADAALTEAKKIDSAIDFAMPSTNGGLRNVLPEGDVTLANVFELMPFDNELLVYELKGSDVQSLLEFIAVTGGQPVSGIRLSINDKKPVNATINGKPFDSSRNYTVLTSDYIAGGGDNVQSFKNPIGKKVLGLKVRDALISYIKDKQEAEEKISSKLDGRISRD